MQTLFIYSKPVILTHTDETKSKGLNDYTRIEEPEKAKLPDILSLLTESHTKGLHISSKQPDKILRAILRNFQHWQAAGGLVTNPKGEILLLFRRGKWDLPKGKAEPGENSEETALREVSEETGLKNIKITRKLTDTWHSYPISVYKDDPQEKGSGKKQKDILKQTHWYLMEFTGNELTVPQIEEDILDIQWIKPENIGKYAAYTYPNIRMVFETAGYLK